MKHLKFIYRAIHKYYVLLLSMWKNCYHSILIMLQHYIYNEIDMQLCNNTLNHPFSNAKHLLFISFTGTFISIPLRYCQCGKNLYKSTLMMLGHYIYSEIDMQLFNNTLKHAFCRAKHLLLIYRNTHRRIPLHNGLQENQFTVY